MSRLDSFLTAAAKDGLSVDVHPKHPGGARLRGLLMAAIIGMTLGVGLLGPGQASAAGEANVTQASLSVGAMEKAMGGQQEKRQLLTNVSMREAWAGKSALSESVSKLKELAESGRLSMTGEKRTAAQSELSSTLKSALDVCFTLKSYLDKDEAGAWAKEVEKRKPDIQKLAKDLGLSPDAMINAMLNPEVGEPTNVVKGMFARDKTAAADALGELGTKPFASRLESMRMANAGQIQVSPRMAI